MANKIYNYNAMRPALVAAHNSGNKKAIDGTMVDFLGIQTAQFEEWKKDCKALYVLVKEYLDLFRAPADAYCPEHVAKMDGVRGKMFPVWATLLSTGEKSKECRELHIVPEHDIPTIIGKAEKNIFVEEVGSVPAHVGEEVFRKIVETEVGYRIAQNGMLSEEDRDTITTFQSAQKTVKRCNEIGEELFKEFSKAKANLEKFGSASEEIKAVFNSIMKDAQAAMEENKKRKEDAQKTVNELKDTYDILVATLAKAQH